MTERLTTDAAGTAELNEGDDHMADFDPKDAEALVERTLAAESEYSQAVRKEGSVMDVDTSQEVFLALPSL